MRSRGNDLFGVLTRPAASARGTGALLLGGAGPLPSFDRNQFRARLARRLGAAGYHALRIDYPGRGDSTGAPPTARLDEVSILPFVEDLAVAADHLLSEGPSRAVLVGQCFGSRLALMATGRIRGLAALALFAAPVHNYNYHRTRPAGGPVSEFLGYLGEAVAHRLPVLLVYGQPDNFWDGFERARSGPLGQLLEEAGDLITLRVIGEPVYDYASVIGQEQVIQITEDWLEEVSDRFFTAAAVELSATSRK